MPTTTTYGYKKPITGERGYFTSLEHNIDRSDAHSHDGLDSAPIHTKNLTKGTSNISSGGWGAVAGKTGLYSQVVTLPTGYNMSAISIKFYIDGGGEDGSEVLLSVEKVTANSYRVYINENGLSLKAVYA